MRDEFIKSGHVVSLLVQPIEKRTVEPERVSLVDGIPTERGQWQENVAAHEAVVNLAGAWIFRRWNRAAKKEIFESRILTTKHIVEALEDRKGKETLLLSASGVGYYGFHGDEVLDENSPPGDDFLAHLASGREAEALKAEQFGARVVLCRYGIVLGTKGGALSKLLPIFNLHLASACGSGDQWFSWIHEKDVVNICLFLLREKDIMGPVNFTAPHPVRNRELAKILDKVLEKPSFVPAIPSFIFRLVLGEFANVFLKGQRVFPKRLIDHNYSFQFPHLKEALEDLIL